MADQSPFSAPRAPRPEIPQGPFAVPNPQSPIPNPNSAIRNPQSAIRNPQSEIGLARSAGVLGLGNVASRLIGLARDTIISDYFGASGELSAFRLAGRVPTMVYDLLVGGMLSAALVPVFSDYARPERRGELAQVASAVFSLIALVMGVIVFLLELGAGPLAGILGDFTDPALQGVLAGSLRVIAPAVLFLGLSGAVTGLLYALGRFSYTALSGAVFNLGIVIAAPLLAGVIGIYALPLGIVGGSLLQLLVLGVGVRGVGLQSDSLRRLSAAWGHPAVQRILGLYAPIALGLIVSQFQIVMDGRWASAAGEQAVSWMGYATTLIQLPLGLVPVAVSLAALPGLSQRAAAGDWEGFRGLFARGLRLVLVLLVPAAVGLWALAEPVIRLLFEHGVFTPADTAMTATALRLYLLGLLFAGVDFLLNYTFYARQDTRTPAIVGVVAVGFYFVAALSLKGPLGFLGLVLADSVKQAGHALIMTFLLLQSKIPASLSPSGGGGVGRLRGHAVLQTALRVAGAALAMGFAIWWLARWLTGLLPAGLVGELGVVALAAGAGGTFYVLALRLLGVAEVVELLAAITRRGRPR